MGRVLRMLGLCLVSLGVAARASADVTVAMGIVTLEAFEAPLAQHGEWLEVPQYGSVWKPSGVAPGWRPYFNGRWLWSEDGWFWASEEPWGWATYHYGRWAWEPQHEWIWVPGPEWAPAWVEWRTSDRHIGWAPMHPRAERRRAVFQEHWVFVQVDLFPNLLVPKVALSQAEVRQAWRATRVVPGGIRGGPPREFVERQRGRPLDSVTPILLTSPYDAARLRGIAIYRPDLRIRAVDPVDRPLVQ